MQMQLTQCRIEFFHWLPIICRGKHSLNSLALYAFCHLAMPELSTLSSLSSFSLPECSLAKLHTTIVPFVDCSG